MSRIKELKNNPINSINIVDFIECILPEDVNQPKYIETMLRILKSDKTYTAFFNEWSDIKKSLKYNDKIDEQPLYMKYFFYLISCAIEVDTLKDYVEFCQDNESNLIENNDLSRYSSFNDIKKEVSKSRDKKTNAMMSKQVHRVYEDDTWLIIRPLTLLSSIKYGANTKWCTTEQKNPNYFVTRRDRGILIYCINKSTNNKIAFEFNGNDNTLNVWTAKNDSIDSFRSGLPTNIMTVLYEEINNSKYRTNASMMSDEVKRMDKKYIEEVDENIPF